MKVLLISVALLLMLLVGYLGLYWWSMRKVKAPAYSVIKRSGAIEIREYAPMLIAQVTVSGSREVAINQGFRLLAGYIFGDNHTQGKASQTIAMTAPVMQGPAAKIAMTAPVLQSPSGAKWQVEFVMPKSYSLATIPKPNRPEIKLIERNPVKTAVIRFSGSITNQQLAKKELKLKQFIEQYQLTAISEPRYAFYNPPWTLPWLRRNEVMIDIQ